MRPFPALVVVNVLQPGNASLSRRENVEKGRKTLDKINKKDIIIAVKQLKAMTKPVLCKDIAETKQIPKPEARGERCKPLVHAAKQPLRSSPRGAERFIPVTEWLRCFP